MSAAGGGLSITVSSTGGEATVAVFGEIDYESGFDLRDVLETVIEGRPDRLVVDLAGVTFCDCGGLGLLVGVMRRARRAGAGFQVMGAWGMTARLIRVFGLAQAMGLERPEGGRSV